MLIGMNLISEFVESVIMTGRLKYHEPVSVLLIAGPESGKTSVVNQRRCKAIQVFSDVTGKGLVEICKTQPEVSHVVLNDLVAIMSHKQTVNRYTLAMINAMTEEGIQALATPGGIEVFQNGKRGIIACLTSALANDGRSWWNKTGLTSRLLPFAFSHSSKLTLTIKALIDENGTAPSRKKEKSKDLRVPAKHVPVAIPRKFGASIRKIADVKIQELHAATDEQGYRRLKQFQSLACGHALRRSFRNPTVGQPEIDFLQRILPYISYDKLTPL